MRKMENETISTFNRRFFHLYHKIPKYFQPPEGVAKLYYANALHRDLSLHILERRFDSLQQMFIDAQEVEENLRASGKILSQVEDNEEWIADGHKTDCGKLEADLDIDQIIDEHKLECIKNLFREDHKSWFADQFVKEQVVIPNFMDDDTEGFVDVLNVSSSLENGSIQKFDNRLQLYNSK